MHPDEDLIHECLAEENNAETNIEALVDVFHKDKADCSTVRSVQSDCESLGAGKAKIEYVPDVIRLERSKAFIHDAKLFSEKYCVSADIYRKKTMISVWLYFTTDILEGERKDSFVRLLDFADELTGIPYPNSMKEWCDYAVILNYMTHHSYVEDRELHPFD